MTDPTVTLDGHIRNGRWTSQEEIYALCLIREYKSVPKSERKKRSLRSILAEELNCDPMRISKKFGGRVRLGTYCNDHENENFSKDNTAELSELRSVFLANDALVQNRRVKRKLHSKQPSPNILLSSNFSNSNLIENGRNNIHPMPNDHEIQIALSEITDNDFEADDAMMYEEVSEIFSDFGADDNVMIHEDALMYEEVSEIFSDEAFQQFHSEHNIENFPSQSSQIPLIYNNTQSHGNEENDISTNGSTLPRNLSLNLDKKCLLEADFDRPALVQMRYISEEKCAQHYENSYSNSPFPTSTCPIYSIQPAQVASVVQEPHALHVLPIELDGPLTRQMSYKSSESEQNQVNLANNCYIPSGNYCNDNNNNNNNSISDYNYTKYPHQYNRNDLEQSIMRDYTISNLST